MIRHKYNAIPTTIDNVSFSSRKEAKRYCELKLLRQSGEIIFFLMQTPFHLPGKVKYVCDFTIFWANGEVTFEDVKGMKTSIYIMKKKMVEELYSPVKIIEV